MNRLVKMLLPLLILGLVAGCTVNKKVYRSSSQAIELKSIDIGQIDFKPDSGRLRYGGVSLIDSNVHQNSNGHILEDKDDLYVLYEEGDGTPQGMNFYAYGIQTKKVKKLKRSKKTIDVRKLAQLNKMKALTMIEPLRRSRCLELTDKNETLGSAHCWNNPLFPARHGMSKKHQYYVTSTNRVNGENSKTFTIEYIDYSGFGVKTDYIEDIVKAIEGRKKIVFLRDENTFDGYMAAFDLSSDFSDLESANSLAKSSSQKSRLSEARKNAGNLETRPSPEKIAEAQTALKYGGYYKLLIDGKYGPGSIEALRKFQTDYNLPVNGKLDSRTMRRLAIYKNAWEKKNEWVIIGESSLSNRINGKTLVTSHRILCRDQKSVVPCARIAILSKKGSSKKIEGQYSATIIDPELRQIRQEGWGVRTSENTTASTFNIGLIEIPREPGGLLGWSRNNRFGNMVAMNTQNNTLKIELPDYPSEPLIVNIEDSGTRHIVNADNRNYKTIDYMGEQGSNNARRNNKTANKNVVSVGKTGNSHNGFDVYNVSCGKKSNSEVIWFNTKRRYWENKSIGFIPKLFGEKDMKISEVAAYICSR